MTDTIDEVLFLRQALGPQRDPVTGLFPFNPQNPRSRHTQKKRRYDFVEIVRNYTEAHGEFTEDVIIDIFLSMLAAAKQGDVQAAKLLLDRFCGQDKDVLELQLTTSKLSDTERAARLVSIIEAAKQRQRITVEPVRKLDG